MLTHQHTAANKIVGAVSYNGARKGRASVSHTHRHHGMISHIISLQPSQGISKTVHFRAFPCISSRYCRLYTTKVLHLTHTLGNLLALFNFTLLFSFYHLHVMRISILNFSLIILLNRNFVSIDELILNQQNTQQT